MTTRTTIRATALLIGGALIAACQPTGSATGAPTGGTPTQAPAATIDGLPSFDLGSFAIPSFNADAELEDMLPDDIGGVAVNKISMIGDSFMGSGQTGSEELQGVLDQFGKSPSDLSIAIGGTTNVAIFAYRIRGVDASAFYQTYMSVSGNTQGASVTDVTIAGKPAKKVVSVAETIYLYASGDVLFTVGGQAITDVQLSEVFAKLP